MGTIATPVPAGALNATGSPWQQNVIIMPDSYRMVLYTDGTDLRVATSQDGTTWTSMVAAAGVATLDARVAMAFVPSDGTTTSQGNYYLYVASGTTLTLYVLGYLGGGTAGLSLTLGTPCTVLTTVRTINGVRVVWDPSIVPVSGHQLSGHPGCFHLLLDYGTVWGLVMLDPNDTRMTTTFPPMADFSQEITLGVTSPTYATNLILRKTATLYAITQAGNGWVAYAISYPLVLAGHPPSNAYATSRETPGLPIAANGVGLCLSDSTSNPGIDLALVNGHSLYVANRSAGGTYTTARAIATLTTPSGGAAIARNVATGLEVAIAQDTFAGTPRVGFILKQAGTWGTWARLDAASTHVQPGMATVAPQELAQLGDAIAYLDGASTFAADYEDNGYSAGVVAPGQPTSLMLTDTSATVNDAYGASSPFIGTTQLPSLQFNYQEAQAGDRLGGYRQVWKLGGTTVYDSGQIGTATGPEPGDPFTTTYPASAPTLLYGNDYTAQVYAYESVSGQISPVSASITVSLRRAPQVTLRTPGATFTVNNPPVTFDYWQADGTPGGSWQVQVADLITGAILYDSGSTIPALSLKASTVAAAFTAPGNTIQTSGLLDGGSTIVVDSDNGALLEVVTVVSCTGPVSGQYTTTVTPNLTKNHAIGARVATRVITPGLPIQQHVTNHTSYNVIATVTTVAATPWNGTDANNVLMAFPIPPDPDNLAAYWVPGTTPTTGGYLEATWNQVAATGSQPAVTNANIYLRESGTSAWTLAAGVTPVIGVNTARIYSVRHNVAYDVAVTSASADAIESDLVSVTGITPAFQRGLWLNDPSNPTGACLELGWQEVSATMPQWDPTQIVDRAQLFGRTAPVTTTGTLYAYGTSADIVYILDQGSEAASLALLQEWDQFQTTLLLRDALSGLMFYAQLNKASPTAVTYAHIKAVAVSLSQVDPGAYPAIVVSS
jgi:hypothetical protein